MRGGMSTETTRTSAAVVVLYHPEPDTVQNILSWSGQVGKVYVVDNSEPPAYDLARSLDAIDNLMYLPQDGNKGVATALNIGAGLALRDGFEWLLTMDQDSRAAPGHVAGLLKCLSGREHQSVAILAPFPSLRSHQESALSGCREVNLVITSGSLLNLQSYVALGPFWDELFIDYVDNEYCLRAKSGGYKVIQCYDVTLTHNLGDIRSYRYLGRTIYNSNHNWMRRYYITRNRLFVVRKYKKLFPGICTGMLGEFRGEIKGIILFEEDKIRKLRMMVKGWTDYLLGRMGRLSD